MASAIAIAKSFFLNILHSPNGGIACSSYNPNIKYGSLTALNYLKAPLLSAFYLNPHSMSQKKKRNTL